MGLKGGEVQKSTREHPRSQNEESEEQGSGEVGDFLVQSFKAAQELGFWT